MGNQQTTFTQTQKTAVPNSSKPLDGIVKRLSLSRLNLKSKKKKAYYPVPPNAEPPSPPSCPEVFQDQDQYFVLRWEKPSYDGGCPLMGYIIQHLELGLPQLESCQDQDDTEAWYSSDPGQITQTECILNNLVPGTTYQFRIVAENLIGFSQPSEISEAIVFNPHGDLDDWFSPPKFSSVLDDTYTVMEHEMLTLTVELKGQPYPIVQWYDKNEQDLGKLDKKKYKTKSSGFIRTLIISSVELSDAGQVKCLGKNKEGQVCCFTTINVEAPPRIRRIQNAEFLQNPYEVNDKEEERLNQFLDDDYEDLMFQAGELVRLKFLYSGSPRPEIHIFHNGEIVREPRIVTELTDKLITIRIENVMRCDRGEWLIKLENVLGEDCTSVLITITDHPNKPGQPEILQLSDNTCILRWDEPEDDGGCPVHNFIVEYFRSEWGVWLKALTSKNPGAKIKDLIPGSKYRFRVKAENLYGVSEASEESAEILITDAPSSRQNEVVMSTLEESIEEDEMEIISHSDFQTEYEQELKRRKPPPRAFLPRSSPRPNVKEKTAVYSREDLIKSVVTSSVDYVQRSQLLRETGKDNELEEYEYDFDKLQTEYEKEMDALKDQLEGSSGDEFDEDSELEEYDDETCRVKETQRETPPPTEEEEVWPRRRLFEPKPLPKPTVLHDKFKDYLAMKINTRSKSAASSMRSLSSLNESKSDKNQSRENLKRLLDFSNDERCITPNKVEVVEENPDEAVKIHEVRRAIILQEEREEAERLHQEKIKQEQRLEMEKREIELEARRRAYRKQKTEDEVVIEEKKIDPEKLTKIFLCNVLVLMAPLWWWYGLPIMLFVFVLILILWNKYKSVFA